VAHDAPNGAPGGPAVGAMEDGTVEMAIGIGLVVLSALMIVFIVRTVSSNLNIGR
jgi:hypothetical protein